MWQSYNDHGIRLQIDYQWLFLVPLKGGRWHIIPQLAVYTTYIPLHLLGEPEATIEIMYGLGPFLKRTMIKLDLTIMGIQTLNVFHCFCTAIKLRYFLTFLVQRTPTWFNNPHCLPSVRGCRRVSFCSETRGERKGREIDPFFAAWIPVAILPIKTWTNIS